jgi:hypothetical protein
LPYSYQITQYGAIALALDWFRKAAKQNYEDASQRVEKIEKEQRAKANN